MISLIFKELFGLFVDDEFLAIGIVAIVAAAVLLSITEAVATTVIGGGLVIAFPAILIAGVVRTLRRAQR